MYAIAQPKISIEPRKVWREIRLEDGHYPTHGNPPRFIIGLTPITDEQALEWSPGRRVAYEGRFWFVSEARLDVDPARGTREVFTLIPDAVDVQARRLERAAIDPPEPLRFIKWDPDDETLRKVETDLSAFDDEVEKAAEEWDEKRKIEGNLAAAYTRVMQVCADKLAKSSDITAIINADGSMEVGRVAYSNDKTTGWQPGELHLDNLQLQEKIRDLKAIVKNYEDQIRRLKNAQHDIALIRRELDDERMIRDHMKCANDELYAQNEDLQRQVEDLRLLLVQSDGLLKRAADEIKAGLAPDVYKKPVDTPETVAANVFERVVNKQDSPLLGGTWR